MSKSAPGMFGIDELRRKFTLWRFLTSVCTLLRRSCLNIFFNNYEFHVAPTNLVKVRGLVRVGIDSRRALVLDSKLLGKLLKIWNPIVLHFGSTCHSTKMNRTVIVCRNYLHYVNKYQRQANLSNSFVFSACVP
ncbi:hypothetical protein C4D60_Mb06t20290 [Musa balbisiana]|uniref:Uncharacterized protein n=1 Tax=Musa balbisiana TaxID=52838 RepID=A0A4S8IQP0_MUSBA|nr:hypothetical protein C4D60_Mb06t20290 [Musa balbisiana]